MKTKIFFVSICVCLVPRAALFGASSGPLNGYGRAIAVNALTNTYVIAGFGYQYNSGNTAGSNNAQNLQTAYAMTCLARYDYVTNRIDTTFNPDANGINGIGKGLGKAGQVITDIASNSFPMKIAIQEELVAADQKIIVAGYCYQFADDQYYNTNEIFVARYKWDGSLDDTFNPNGDLPGVAIYTILGVEDQGFALLLLPDKKIIVAGGASGQLFVMKLNVADPDPEKYDGSLDTSFNAGGTMPGVFTCSVLGVATNPPTGPAILGYDCAYGIVRQADGKLIAAGTGSTSQGPNSIIMVRLTTDGQLDLTFGTGATVIPTAGHIISLTGKVITKVFGFDDRGFDIALQADGKIVVAGTTNDSFGNYYYCVVRYLSSGEIDKSFGPGGIVETPGGFVNLAGKAVVAVKDSLFTVANEIRVQPADQKILISGFNNFPKQNFAMFVSRLLPSGFIDRGHFNPHGEQRGLQFVTLDSLDSKSFGLAVQPDKKILLVGSTFINSAINQRYAFAVVRIKEDGGIDNATISSFTHRLLETTTNDEDDKESAEEQESIYFSVINEDGMII